MTSYIALLRKDSGSDYGVNFPDFPGCITAGVDLEEAKAMAGEALAFHVEGMIEDAMAIPTPSSLDAIMAANANSDAVAFLVDVDTESDKAERINVTIRRRLLARIDSAATEEGLTRSAFLADAALQKLGKHPD